jgi:aminoglycoside phosphotransferase (APT) family kinase protein
VAKERHFHDWGGLSQFIQSNLGGRPGFGKRPQVGRLSAIHEGIGHDNFCFVASGKALILRMQKMVDPIRSPEEAMEMLAREAETLRSVARCQFPHPVPALVCAIANEQGQTIGLIESCLPGGPLSHVKNGVHGRSRLEVIAEVAARVHALPISEFAHLSPRADSESHVRTELDLLPPIVFDWPIAVTTRDWILKHLIHRPAVVLHGDLLPQNLLWDMMGTGDIAVVDWEYAQLGDPAYDLAILTRGDRQPLKESGGFEKLLAAYGAATGTAIPGSAVRIHEMLMILGWLGEAALDRAEGRMKGQGPDYYVNQLTSVLRRSGASG